MSDKPTPAGSYVYLKAEPQKSIVHIGVAREPARLLVDAHMHIQSGRCSTLLFLRGALPVATTFDRTSLEWGGRKVGGGKEKMVDESATPTDKVGASFLAKVEELHRELRPMKPYDLCADLFICSVVMTMDMEYAHLGGYFGLKIYHPVYASESDQDQDGKPVCYWYAKPGTSGRIASGSGSPMAAPSEQGETMDAFKALKRKREKQGVAGYLFDAQGRKVQTVPIRCSIAKTPDEEGDLYENWKTQQKLTIEATVAGKLRLLPMLHYDPRRWQGGDSQAFSEVGAGGLYLGFKMYTAQGYRPWDPRLSNLSGFYARCEKAGIPILNHCTPSGAPTYDREHYIHFTHPRDTAYDEAQKRSSIQPHLDTLPIQDSGVPTDDPDTPEEVKRERAAWRMAEREALEPTLMPQAIQRAAKDYFNEHFVSPKAWREVLNKYPSLRLCLAHFGGDTKVGREWGEEIIRMMEEEIAPGKRRYPNFYADLSSSFAEEAFRNYFKGLLAKHPSIADRVLFGTDWYLTLMDNVTLLDYCKTAKSFLDGLDPTLWFHFTEENPYRFYRLGEQIGRIAENLIREREKISNQKKSNVKGRESQEPKSDEDGKMYTIDVRNRMRLIQSMAHRLAN